ncbi:putative integral membrane protein [Theileria parva strain Muguga]|uniref:putative integral membrane protein n=1 Tax=Theileria parva strain Muguga TaxID=333668 RepID=UPI001C620771|nr:putative integral membrane protein [Theileria parva strain Muguga]KAF5153184.1 putative integral membrane protein [Theileria parva strain Muguga]
MRRFSVKTLKKLPYQMATLYFILFVISITASVITVNCGDEVFKRYTSCHGTKVYNINWIGAVVFLQILLCFVSIEPEQKNTGKNQPVVEITAPDSNRLMNFNLNETLSMYSRGNSNTDYKVVIGNNPKKPNKRNKHKTNNSNTSKLEGSKNGSTFLNLSESSLSYKFVKASEEIRKRVRICWSSIWMVSYNFVIFMGVHGSVLASRIHSGISLNRYAIETCPHLAYFPFNLSSPVLPAPILSESVLLVTYISFTIHEIVIRKTESCYLIKNFFGKHYFKESLILGSARLIIQVVLFSLDIAIIVMCILTGFGTPFHVLVGFSISMLSLWINSLLSQLLDLTHYGEMKAPTLDYSYIWSILSAFVLWFCGFFYYVSVYGFPYKRPYVYLNPISWILLLSLTHFKRHEIFNSSQYLQGFVPTFT